MSEYTNMKRGTIELLLLSILRDEDMYGYQLSQELTSRSGGKFELQEGSLYPVLYRLEKDGYISSRHFPVPGSRRFRVYYHLEQSGELYFQKIRQDYFSFHNTVTRVLEREAHNEAIG